LCGADANIEFSDPAGDAPCPSCGHLLWRSAMLLERFRDRFAESAGTAGKDLTVDTSFGDLASDSLDAVELVMELEEEFDIDIPDKDAEKLLTIGDALRYIEEKTRRPPH